jgi:hypothetical protein
VPGTRNASKQQATSNKIRIRIASFHKNGIPEAPPLRLPKSRRKKQAEEKNKAKDKQVKARKAKSKPKTLLVRQCVSVSLKRILQKNSERIHFFFSRFFFYAFGSPSNTGACLILCIPFQRAPHTTNFATLIHTHPYTHNFTGLPHCATHSTTLHVLFSYLTRS